MHSFPQYCLYTRNYGRVGTGTRYSVEEDVSSCPVPFILWPDFFHCNGSILFLHRLKNLLGSWAMRFFILLD
jgi:hypothetical protein